MWSPDNSFSIDGQDFEQVHLGTYHGWSERKRKARAGFQPVPRNGRLGERRAPPQSACDKEVVTEEGSSNRIVEEGKEHCRNIRKERRLYAERSLRLQQVEFELSGRLQCDQKLDTPLQLSLTSSSREIKEKLKIWGFPKVLQVF